MTAAAPATDTRTVPLAEHERLAMLVLAALDHQVKLRANPADVTLRMECRDHERRLRQVAEAALAAARRPAPSLFGGDQ